MDNLTYYLEILKLEPGNIPALKGLAEVYKNNKDWENLIDTYKKLFSLSEGNEERIKHLSEVANIYRNQLNQDDQAIEFYFDLLELKPDDQTAIDALIDLLKNRNMLPELNILLEGKSYLKREPSEINSLNEEIISNYLSLGMHEQALSKLESSAEPSLEIVNSIYNLLKEKGFFAEIIEEKEFFIKNLRNNEQLKGLYLTLADMYERLIQDPYESAYNYEMALTVDSENHTEIFNHLKQLYSNLNEPILMIPILLKLRENIEPENRYELDKTIGLSYLSIGERASAIPYLRGILEVSPDNKELLYAILETYITLNSNDDANEIILKLIKVEDDSSKKIPLYNKAIDALREKHNYVEAAQLIKELIELTDDPSYFSLLENTYTENNDYNSLVTFFLDRLRGKEDDAESAKVWANLGNAYLKGFSHYEYAADSYSRALSLDSENQGYIESLLNIYALTENRNEYEQLLLKLKSLTTDTEKKLDIDYKLGELYLSIRDYDRATDIYNSILERVHNDSTSILALERIYREIDDPKSLATALEKKLDITDDRLSTMTELGSILFDKAIDTNKSKDVLWQALELSPDSIDIIHTLKRIYDSTDDYIGYERLYTLLIERADNPKTKADLLVKLGEIEFEKLAKTDSAIVAFDQAVQIEPDNHKANYTLAKLYFNTGSLDIAEPYFRFSITNDIIPENERSEFTYEYAMVLDKIGKYPNALEAYKKAYELNSTDRRYAEAYAYAAYANHDYVTAISALESLLKLPRQEENPSEIYKKLLHSYEAINEFRSASIYLMKLIEKEPMNIDYLKLLESLALKGEDYSLLASTLRKEAELSNNSEEKTAFIIKSAGIFDEKLNQPEQAIKSLEGLVKTELKNLDIYTRLSSLYIKTNNTKELTSTIQKILGFELKDEQRIKYMLELAKIWKDDKQKAIAIYIDILSSYPQNNEAYTSLSNLYEDLKDFNSLSNLYEQRLSIIQLPDEAIRLNKKLASIKSKELRNFDSAINMYQDILKIKPSETDIYPDIETLLIKKGDHASLDKFYDIAINNISQNDTRFDYLVKQAELRLNTLNDPTAAIQSYESAYELNKTKTDIIVKLARITASRNLSDKAIRYYKESIKLKELTDELKAELYYEYGNLIKDKGNNKDAHSAFKEAYNILSSNIDYRISYGESACLMGFYKDAYDTLKNVVYAHEEELNKEQLHKLYKTLSNASHKLGNIQQAVEYLLRAVDIDDNDTESLVKLEELTAVLGNFELEIEVLNKLSKIITNVTDRAQILIKIAKIKHDRLFDLNGAVPLLRDAMTVLPGNIQILGELIQIYREMSDVDNEIEMLEKLLKIETSTDDSIKTCMRLGEIYIEFKDDLNTAKKYYLEALKKAPSSITVLKGLGKIYELQGNFSGLAELYQKFVKILLPKEPKNMLPLLKELGELYSNKLNNMEFALQQYQTIVDIEPADVNAHLSIASILSKNKAQLSDAVREYAVVLKYAPANIDAIRFISKFYEQKKDFDRVFLYYSILKLFGDEKDLERIFVDANKNKQPKQPKIPISDDLFHTHLLNIKTRGPLKDILNVFPDSADNLFKPDLKSYGAGKQQRITQKTSSWQEYADMLKILGISDIDIYHTSSGSFRIVIENTNPPSLIVNTAYLNKLSQQEKLFILIEYLTYIKSGFTLPLKLGKERFNNFINIIIKIINPSISLPQESNPSFQTLLETVSSALSRKQKTALEEPVRKYLKIMNHYAEDWFNGIEMTGVRTAAFMIGDIEPVFSAMVKWHVGDLTLLSNKEKRKETFSSSELMQDFLQFYLSDSHFVLRTRLGMSILSV
ncbi:MAG: hypothetical protein M1381_06875 [Deltaproteobacteria bacterium]|nr:hypothetical protein [Deltaproteobacteria bacterium]MCL5792972.1 hypothetical protein [Deltaproteobacteria bacterium]